MSFFHVLIYENSKVSKWGNWDLVWWFRWTLSLKCIAIQISFRSKPFSHFVSIFVHISSTLNSLTFLIPRLPSFFSWVNNQWVYPDATNDTNMLKQRSDVIHCYQFPDRELRNMRLRTLNCLDCCYCCLFVFLPAWLLYMPVLELATKICHALWPRQS